MPLLFLNLHVKRLDPEGEYSGQLYLDPTGPEIKPNMIRAEKLDKEECVKRFG